MNSGKHNSSYVRCWVDFFRHKDKTRWDYFCSEFMWPRIWKSRKPQFYSPYHCWGLLRKFPHCFSLLCKSPHFLALGWREKETQSQIPLKFLSTFFLVPDLSVGWGPRGNKWTIHGDVGQQVTILVLPGKFPSFSKTQEPTEGNSSARSHLKNERQEDIMVWLSFHCYVVNLPPSLLRGWERSLLSPGRWPIQGLCCILVPRLFKTLFSP